VFFTHIVPECVGAAQTKPTDKCQSFLQANEKARQEWGWNIVSTCSSFHTNRLLGTLETKVKTPTVWPESAKE